jgi:oxygen-dependent protoporphyrinogen oxidase
VLGDVYGFLIPARERRHVAAVSIERNKSPDRARRGELLEVFLAGDAADRLLGDTDADVLAAVIPELERSLPGVGGAVTMTHLIRWPAAEPRSPVGRARAVAAYRRAPRPDRRVLLAGDYVSLPWTDGAADAGEWAAAALVTSFSGASRAAGEARAASSGSVAGWRSPGFSSGEHAGGPPARSPGYSTGSSARATRAGCATPATADACSSS